LFKNDRLVKSVRFEEFRNIGNPIQMARVYNSRGVDELVFLDITASKENRKPLLDVIKCILEECFMPLTVGGGIKTLDEINDLLKIGADKVSINTAAVENSSFIREASKRFGSSNIVVSIDAKRISGGKYEVFIRDGSIATGIDVIDFAKRVEDLGVGEILLNSMDRDGMMTGFDISLLHNVSRSVKIPIIGCGGAGTPQDFVDCLTDGGVSAVAAASIFHFTEYTPTMVKKYMKECGLDVRLNY
jgi:cyclase